MKRKSLVERANGKVFSKPILILDPKNLSPALNSTAWKILKELSIKPSYPNELAKKMKMHEQKVYYHIKRLHKAGLIEIMKEEKKEGALCKYFFPTCSAFGIELSEEKHVTKEKKYKKLEEFFHEFIKSGVFDGIIVVGSPLPHGPFLTAARDGHFAAQLSILLGNLCELPGKFVVNLDTEVKAEKAEKNNMILIGGPITNMITSDINEKLKIRFKWEATWKIFSNQTGNLYFDEDIGLIAKIRNPWDEKKAIIILAGLKFEGTRACIIALTEHFDKILKNYEPKEEFFCLIKGLDRDGDGKFDDVEILE